MKRYCREDLIIRTSIFSNSMQSVKTEDDPSFVRKFVAHSRLIQYLVSAVSFSAMFIFETKSGLLCACLASATFAPILVPLRSNCLERIYSFFCCVRYLYQFTIRTAKLKLFVPITLSIPSANLPFQINFQLSIFNFQFIRRFRNKSSAPECPPGLRRKCVKPARCFPVGIFQAFAWSRRGYREWRHNRHPSAAFCFLTW